MDAQASDTAPATGNAEDAPGKCYGVGEFSVTRVTERRANSFTPAFLLPQSESGLIERHGARLGPDATTADSKRLQLSIHTWVLRKPGRTILIDTGIGNAKDRPGKAIFHQLETPYLARLRAAGVDPADVDLVLNTHLHIDHVGWNTRLVNGRWVPTFPNATYIFPQAELEIVRDHAGHLKQVYEDSVKPVIDSGQARTVQQDGEDVGDGLQFKSTPGHTGAHMSVWLDSGRQCALFAGDVMHHPVQVLEPHLNSVFCDFAELAGTTRGRVLHEVAGAHALYFSSHFPGTSVGHVEREGRAFEWRSV